MKSFTAPMQTVELQTGKVVAESKVEWKLLPPPAGACQECGHPHAPDEPHNAQKLYYQYAFYGQHGRWPTWKDAVAHCAPATREAWERELRAKGAWS